MNRHIYKEGDTIDLVPVIVTTASLWLSNAKLETTSLETGELDLSALEVTPKGHVTYQYHASPDLRPSRVERRYSSSVSDALLNTSIRSVQVVNQARSAVFCSSIPN